MTWANFYLFCFLVGFLWSLVSLLIGHLNIDLPFHHGDSGFGHGDSGHGMMHDGGGMDHGDLSDGGGGHDAGSSDHVQGISVSPINLGTIAAFLAWFGGAGYLLASYSKIWFVWGLGLSVVSGLAGASVIFWFLAKVLIGKERNLNPADYHMTGVLGRVVSSIREGGTGEIVYSQEGTRRTCGARSEDGKSIPQGVEVLVTRYHKGIAYVRRWDELERSEVLENPYSGQT
ncbi:MAG: NfeD family protein [Acidobacteria bacterium]|nr:NfeD family protein [Acidobacteriota bacterium]